MGDVILFIDKDVFMFIICVLFGVVGVIFLWNFLVVILIWKMVLVLVYGNIVVIKLVIEIVVICVKIIVCFEEVGFLVGVINLVIGLGFVVG